MSVFVVPFAEKAEAVHLGEQGAGQEGEKVKLLLDDTLQQLKSCNPNWPEVTDFQVLSDDGNTLFGLHFTYSTDLPKSLSSVALIAIDIRYKKLLKRVEINQVIPKRKSADGEDLKSIHLVQTKKTNEFWCVICFGQRWGFYLLCITASGPFERHVFVADSEIKSVSLTKLFPAEGEQGPPIGGDYFAHILKEGNVVYLLTGWTEISLHELDLTTFQCSSVKLRNTNPPDNVPWVFSTGVAIFHRKIFFTARRALGHLSAPEFVTVVDLDRKVLEFEPVCPDPLHGYPEPRVCVGFAQKNGAICFFGGVKAEGDPMFDRPFTEPLKDAWMLNLRTLSWTKVPDIPMLQGPMHVVTATSNALVALWNPGKGCSDAESKKCESCDTDPSKLCFAKAWLSIPPLMELAMIKVEQCNPGIGEMSARQQMAVGIPPRFRKR